MSSSCKLNFIGIVSPRLKQLEGAVHTQSSIECSLRGRQSISVGQKAVPYCKSGVQSKGSGVVGLL